MRSIISVVSFVILTSCGQEPVGKTQSARAIVKGLQSVDELIKAIRQRHFRHVADALELIKKHPKVKTTGIESNLFADELGVHPNHWGKLVNTDPDLVTKRMRVDDKDLRFIFHKDHIPEKQVTRAIESFTDEQLKQGIPIEKIAEKVSYKQPEWNDHSFHTSIGLFIDKEKFTTKLMKRVTMVFIRQTVS